MSYPLLEGLILVLKVLKLILEVIVALAALTRL